MTKQRVFINNDNMALFICSNCERTIVMDVAKHKDIDRAVVIEHKCECGHYSRVLLERRKFSRGEVNISGKYALTGEDNKKTMTVKDLSRAGLKFEIHEETDIKIGDRLTAEFYLNNTLVKKDVFVRKIFGRNIGAEFCSRDPENPADRAIALCILNAKLV
jgi:hypothetical protein